MFNTTNVLINLIVPYYSIFFLEFQVDGLMAGRPFWEGELGVRISTAWLLMYLPDFNINNNNGRFVTYLDTLSGKFQSSLLD